MKGIVPFPAPAPTLPVVAADPVLAIGHAVQADVVFTYGSIVEADAVLASSSEPSESSLEVEAAVIVAVTEEMVFDDMVRVFWLVMIMVAV